jgi:16S rRNA A1518/A1519 N6-dimethyltransferase RsmA/KsgA/DIM1 with predicted DNA glycosylase/AP lyase activity
MYVDKLKFYPMPKTNSVVIDLIKLPDPIENKNLGLFLRQYMYQHEGQLVKNSLMEGLIKYARFVYSKKVTKNQAREIVAKSQIPKELLEKQPDNPEIYKLAEGKFNNSSLNDLNILV